MAPPYHARHHETRHYERSVPPHSPNSSPRPRCPKTLYQTNRGHPKAPFACRRGGKEVWLRPLAVLQPRIEQMILPDTVDAQIFARIALAYESGVFQKPRRAGIGRDAGGLDAMQPQGAEGEWNDG